jgi:hypothetical protein
MTMSAIGGSLAGATQDFVEGKDYYQTSLIVSRQKRRRKLS